jgi:hypothetical protein
VAALVLAGAALGADTATIAVSHVPMAAGGPRATTIHVGIPQSTSPIGRIAIYAPRGYAATLGQPAGTTIGQVTATAFSHDNGLTLPLDGPVVADDPAKHAADLCAPGAHAAVWILNLAVGGQTLPVPLYVDATAGSEQALGSYRLVICLPPPDVPQGAPGRAAFGAQLLDARFTVNGIFSPPAGGLLRWESLFTPYNPGAGTPNALGTFEARALVPLPITLALKVKYARKAHRYTLAGGLVEGGLPGAGLEVGVYRGTNRTSLRRFGTTRASSNGFWSKSGVLRPRKTTYFQAKATALERDDTAKGCLSPLPAAVAPAGCVSATLPPWSVASAVVRLKP